MTDRYPPRRFQRGSMATTVPDDQDDQPITLAGLHIDVLDGAFSWYIRSLDSVVSRDLDHRMAHLDIAKGKGKITTLLLVDDYPGVRPSQIAEVLMRDRPATGRIIDRLVQAGDIRRETAPEDQRAQALFITEKGHALADEVRGIIREQENEFFDFIAEEDRAQFMRMLKRAYLNMRKKLE
ncbi:MarR family winged helix-turn-helix transcriptional regulator [Pseudodonghicola xiamenensis]|uniref:MarR family transcriptional regulator n=1 Tax=Pseudodonghicola xiamenensis TaxID=337702 RepID=A0A8J3H4H6_9RHOB|nr:MarR family transcriptional regulator [Pseudodonghicola xiamenensis]GHG85677.1 MarR family transcriptional regulator [Pseudodonghicola xiamenensis]